MLRAVDENIKRAFDSKCQTLKSGCYQRLATACPMPQAAQEATAFRLRAQDWFWRLRVCQTSAVSKGWKGLWHACEREKSAWQLPSLMEGVYPKFLVWRHVFFPGFCFSVRDLLSVSLFSSSPQFGIFQLIMLELVRRGGSRTAFRRNGARFLHKAVIIMDEFCQWCGLNYF